MLNSFTAANTNNARNGIASYKCKQTTQYSYLPQNLQKQLTTSSSNPLLCVYFENSPLIGLFYSDTNDATTKSDISAILADEKSRAYHRLGIFTDNFDSGKFDVSFADRSYFVVRLVYR